MEKTLNGKNAEQEKTLNGKTPNGTKCRMEKQPNGTKRRMEKRRMGKNVEWKYGKKNMCKYFWFFITTE